MAKAQKISIRGFLAEPRRNASGQLYHGRFTCPLVQLTKDPESFVATFTITALELADAAANGILWTDQDVQRGIQPTSPTDTPRELALSQGYPDSARYIFDAKNADNMVEKLLSGEKLFLNPLVWNLRPGQFEAYWDSSSENIYLYAGKVYLPDSHHRQQAIIKAVNLWRDSPSDYPKFTGNREFKVELYFLDRESEGDYFFDKNQRPKPVAKSKAFDLTTVDDLSLLAKKVIDGSEALRGNVNRVTDRLGDKQPHVATLSTVREMMRTFSAGDSVDTSQMDGMALVGAQFIDMLAAVRPEIGQLSQEARRQSRENSLVDAAVMMHGYAAIMKDYNSSIPKLGTAKAKELWKNKLGRLSKDVSYTMHGWSGDFFDKRNPLWLVTGIVKPGRDAAKLTVLNTGAARSECGRILRQLMAIEHVPHDISFLARN